MTALTYCLFILGILSLMIWVYQAIILPSIRQRLRFELFDLRDQTRELVIAGKLKEQSAVFHHLHRSLNVLIKAVPGFDFAFLSRIEIDDPDVNKRAAQFQQLMDESIPEVRQIFHRAVTVMAVALIANSLFWFNMMLFAAIPVAIPQGIWKLCAVVFEKARSRALPAFELKEKDLDQLPLVAFTATG